MSETSPSMILLTSVKHILNSRLKYCTHVKQLKPHRVHTSKVLSAIVEAVAFHLTNFTWLTDESYVFISNWEQGRLL